ncbi:hypothetical protein ASE01_17570 [Nocardioides sp. Root190]|uniref:hypothetical protein n=1 Tax=Nocardioides sp. Root190 TaxID=1736488 RepID=UPI0006F37ED3|nr:hypothetical protein [Nocardioides sp. Root190]KRB73827.1 hypothetical protein ASE01_17570 [Nocardioides sp. Root190]
MHKTLHRFLLLVVALATGAISLVAVAPAAHAAPAATVSKISSTKTVVLHGTTVKIYGCGTLPAYGDCISEPGAAAPFGTLTLQRRLVGSTSWTNISSRKASDNPVSSWILTPTASAYYRVSWNPGAPETYAPTTTSARQTRLIRVARNLHDGWTKSSFRFYGKVTPSYSRKPVYIQKTTCSNPTASTCKWTSHKTLTTTSAGNWSVKLPAYSRTTYFRAYVKPSSGYAPSYSRYYIETKKYRPAARMTR